MLINKDTAISTSRILLVPYDPHHVPTYHAWMQNEEIRDLTASEPLTLDEEYAMQRTWRADGDKLTFIACLPLSDSSASSLSSPPPHQSDSALPTMTTIKAHTHDCSSNLLGDVNLFLSPTEEGEEDDDGNEALQNPTCTGELELMIAPSSQRRKGFGRAAVLAFMHYIALHMEDIMSEFAESRTGAGAQQGQSTPNSNSNSATKKRWKLNQLRAKIGSKNLSSIGLFESLGFVKMNDGKENYFGEVELVFGQNSSAMRDWTAEMLERWGVKDYREHVYDRST